MTKFRCTIEKIRKYTLILVCFFAIYGWVAFADFAGARSGIAWRDISGAGWLLWLFLIVGALIILLQLVPATILFFSVIGTAYKNKQVTAATDTEHITNEQIPHQTP